MSRGKKPVGFSEKQIIEWAAKYYDEVFGVDQNPREAEIVDANIDVPKEEIEKAEKTLLEKFNFVYGDFEKSSDTNFHNKVNNEDVAYGLALKDSWTSVGVGLGSGMFTYLTAAGATGDFGLSAIVAGLVSVGVLAESSIIRIWGRGKQEKKAADLGLTMAEFDHLKKFEKAMLKYVKKNGTLPSPDDDLTGGHLYDMYLQMKMLNHKYLVEGVPDYLKQSKINNENEENKGDK